VSGFYAIPRLPSHIFSFPQPWRPAATPPCPAAAPPCLPQLSPLRRYLLRVTLPLLGPQRPLPTHPNRAAATSRCSPRARHIPPLVARLRITDSPAPIPRPGHRIDLDGVLFSPVLQGTTTKATRRAVRRGPRPLRRRALAGFAAISDEMIHILVQLSRSSNEYFRLHELRCSFILTKLYKLASLNS
jgi:hypothetical protein